MTKAKQPQAVTAANSSGDIFDLAAARFGEAWKHETGQNAAMSGVFLDIVLGLFKSLLGNCGGTGTQVQQTAANPNLRTRVWLRTQAARELQSSRRDENVSQVVRAVLRTGATASPDEIEEFRAAELRPELRGE